MALNSETLIITGNKVHVEFHYQQLYANIPVKKCKRNYAGQHTVNLFNIYIYSHYETSSAY